MFKRTKLNAALMPLFGATLALTGAPASAQQQLDRVEVTGSSIKRIDGETALPVTVIKRVDIEKTGASNVQELVDRLSMNSGGGRSLAESVGETSATGQSGASLRGLGRERTLLLLNGRRLSPYPFSGLGVDLNAIPLSAIERIEILRDGASATYGSDAIGGVMNFITRKDFQGGEINVGYESPQKSGGKVESISGAFGFGDLGKDRYNVLGSLSYQKYGQLKASQRSFASTGNRPDIGVVKTSGNTFPANGFIAAPNTLDANGNLVTGALIPGTSGFPNCAPPDSFNDGSTPNCRYDYSHYVDLIPKSERLGGLLRGTVQLGDTHQLFGEVSYSRNDITFSSSQTPSTTTGKPSYLYPSGGRYYPTAAADAFLPGYRGDIRLSWRIVDGGNRVNKVTSEQTRIVAGAEGTLAGWDYKAAIVSAESKARDVFVSGLFSDQILVQGLATGNINPFGPNDATGLALLKAAELSGDNRVSKTSSNGFDGQISSEIFQLPAGPVGLALGFDTRKEKYLDGYSALAASGDIVGGSGDAGKVEASRNVTGFFGELAVPIIKGLDLTGAIRTDRYSSTSGSSRDGAFNSPNVSATSPKLSLRWAPMKELLVRGSIGKGFRAPALDDLFRPSAGTNTGGNFTDPYYDSIRGCTAAPNTDYCNTQLTATNFSNPNLKPEKSKTLSFGLVFEPSADLTLGVDYFDIKITNGITALTADDILKDWFKNQTGPTTSSSVYADRLVRNASTGYLDYVRASTENVAVLRASGFDLSAKYRARTAVGTFTPAWEATYLTKSQESNVVSGNVVNTLGKYTDKGPVPRLKQNISLDWEQGAWAAGVKYYWQSGYEDYDEVSRVSAYDLWDVQAQFKGVKNLTVIAGIRNLLDKKPPTSVQEDYFQVGYDPSYSDVKGRTYYVRLGYKF